MRAHLVLLPELLCVLLLDLQHPAFLCGVVGVVQLRTGHRPQLQTHLAPQHADRHAGVVEHPIPHPAALPRLPNIGLKVKGIPPVLSQPGPSRTSRQNRFLLPHSSRQKCGREQKGGPARDPGEPSWETVFWTRDDVREETTTGSQQAHPEPEAPPPTSISMRPIPMTSCLRMIGTGSVRPTRKGDRGQGSAGGKRGGGSRQWGGSAAADCHARGAGLEALP